MLAALKIEDIKAAVESNSQGAAEDIIVLIGENKATAKALAELKKENETLTKVNVKLEAVVEELTQKLEEQPIAQASGFQHASFKHNDVVYGFNFPKMKLGGKPISYEEVIADKDVQAKLIAVKSGMIYEK